MGGAELYLAQKGAIHGNPASGHHQVPSHGIVQYNTTNQYLPDSSYKGEGVEWEYCRQA